MNARVVLLSVGSQPTAPPSTHPTPTPQKIIPSTTHTTSTHLTSIPSTLHSIIEPGGIYASILLGGADVRGDGSSGAGGVAETHLPGADKVDVVCDAMREAVEQLPGGRGKYLTVIATAYAR